MRRGRSDERSREALLENNSSSGCGGMGASAFAEAKARPGILLDCLVPSPTHGIHASRAYVTPKGNSQYGGDRDATVLSRFSSFVKALSSTPFQSVQFPGRKDVKKPTSDSGQCLPLAFQLLAES